MKIIIMLLTTIYNLIDFYRIFNFIKRIILYIKKIKEVLKYLEENKINLKQINLKQINSFFKNIKKISKFINLKTITPIILCLLFSDSIVICESEKDIHHYLLTKDGELVEVTNEEERIRIEKEKIEEDIKKKKMEEEDIKLLILLILFLIASGSILLFLFLGGFDDVDEDEEFRPKDDDDDATLERKRKAYFRKYPPSEPIYTPYLKKWLGKEDRLRTKTNPFYVGNSIGKVYDHFDADYVDKYNKYILEWEDDHIYKSNRKFSRYREYDED